jgi:hypothetical protein
MKTQDRLLEIGFTDFWLTDKPDDPNGSEQRRSLFDVALPQ